MPSGEVSEVCGQLKETLVTSSSSSSSQTKRGDNKAAFTLQQDIGTMLYDGESSYFLKSTLWSWCGDVVSQWYICSCLAAVSGTLK